MPCSRNHSLTLDEDRLETLEEHQKHGHGRHKCCQCAYNIGFEQGLVLQSTISIDTESLDTTQAQPDGRHKSVHQAFGLGYLDGIAKYIADNRS